jgi:hypothetical protein
MQYACLVYTPQAGPDATPDVYAEYMALAEDATKRGVMKGGHELADSGTATTLRVRNGKRAVTDGPFAETKEVLGGFFVFDCASLDEALEWAAKIPAVRYGSIEIRPIVAHEN